MGNQRRKYLYSKTEKGIEIRVVAVVSLTTKSITVNSGFYPNKQSVWYGKRGYKCKKAQIHHIAYHFDDARKGGVIIAPNLHRAIHGGNYNID